MKKGILKALTITALVAVSAVGGLALGAEISNGFETTYSESAYEDYGDKKQQIGYEQGKQEGLEEGFEAGQTYRDPEKTYLEDIINGVQLNVYKMDSGLTLLSGASSSFQGIYKLNADGSVEQILDSGYGWDIFNELSNGNVLISSSNSTSTGMYLYNFQTHEIISIEMQYSSTYSWKNYKELKNGNVLLCSNITPGIYLLDTISNKTTQLYNSGYGWNSFYELSNGNVFISGTSSSNACLLLYNISTNEISIISETGYGWVNFFELSNGDVLCSADSRANGLYLFNTTSNELSQISETGASWKYFYKLSDDNLLITSSTSVGIYLYNVTTKEFTQLISSSSNFRYFYQITNGDILICGGDSRIYLYDSSTNEIIKLSEYRGSNWDTFTPDKNGVIISYSKKPEQVKLYYDFATGQLTDIEEEVA